MNAIAYFEFKYETLKKVGKSLKVLKIGGVGPAKNFFLLVGLVKTDNF